MSGDTSGGAAIVVDRLSKTYPVYPSPMAALKEVLTGRRQHTEARALDEVSFRVRRGERVGVVGANGAGKSTLLRILAGTLDHGSGRYRVRGAARAILELGTGFHEDCTGRENVLMGGLCLGYRQADLEERLDWIIDFSELRAVMDRPLRTYSAGMKMRLMYAVAFCKPVEIMIIDEALSAGDGAFVRKCTQHIVELCGGGTTALVVSHNLYFLERLCDRVLYLRDGRLVADGDPLWVCKLYEQDLGRAFVAGGRVAEAPVFRRRESTDERRLCAERAAPVASERLDESAPDDARREGPTSSPSESPTEPSTASPDVAAPRACEVSPVTEPRPADVAPSGPSPAAATPPGRSPTNGSGAVLTADGTWEAVDFTGAPPVRHLGLVRLAEARLYDGEGRPTDEIRTGEPARFSFVLESRLRKEDVHIGFMIWNDRDEHVATTTNVCSLDGGGRPNGVRQDLEEGTFAVDVAFPSLRLGAGRYTLRFGVAPGREHFSPDDLLLSEDRCLAFSVLRPDHVQTVHYEPHSTWSPLRRAFATTAAATTTATPTTPDPSSDTGDVSARGASAP